MEGRRKTISSLELRMQLSRVREMRDVGRSPPTCPSRPLPMMSRTSMQARRGSVWAPVALSLCLHLFPRPGVRKREGVANSGWWHFIAGDYLGLSCPGWASSHADPRSLPHREAPALSMLPGPGLKLSPPECRLPRADSFAPQGVP